MSASHERHWRNYSEPYGGLGPLVLPSEVLNLEGEAGVTRYDMASLSSLLRTARYVTQFLTQPHPELGRPGPVCPFTTGALDRQLLRLAASPLRVNDKAGLLKAMSLMRTVFLEMGKDDEEARSEIYKAIIVTFPHVPRARAPELIETVQKALKPEYVADGLMIGEFYPGCPAPGLHNRDFRPLDTPDPCLAIRRITLYDAPFMVDDDRYVSGYLARFGAEGSKRLRTLIENPAYDLNPGRALVVRALVDRHDADMASGDVVRG